MHTISAIDLVRLEDVREARDIATDPIRPAVALEAVTVIVEVIADLVPRLEVLVGRLINLPALTNQKSK